MKKLGLGACFLLAVACGSGSAPRPAAAPDPQPQAANVQAALTELLERIDVMNDRITRLEKSSEEKAPAPARAATPPPAASEPARTPATARAATSGPLASAQIADTYRDAIVLFGKNRYPEARAAFQQVFQADAAGELADNALYWIGETYYSAGDFTNAGRYYKRVTEEYGDQNKAPDAMFKLALTYEKSSDLALARSTLQDVIARYPYSAPAAAAKSELNRIKY